MRHLIAALTLLACSMPVSAQSPWPAREVKIVIGFSAGGTTDIITRTLAPELTKAWGQPVVIENRAGAAGNIGAELVVKARPDGHTLFMGSVGPLAVNASLYQNLSFDNLKDLAPVTLVADVPNMLVFTPRAMPVTGLRDFLALVKAHPGKYFYASTGSGTASHLAGELLRMQTGIDITHVPYKGAVALNDVLAGESVHFMFPTIPAAIAHVRAGKLRAIAVTSAKRSAAVPDLPTIAESGVAGFDASSWFGLVGPAGLPRDVAQKIHSDIARILKAPEMRERFVAQGADPVGSTPDEFTAYMRTETAKWARLVKASGAKAD